MQEREFLGQDCAALENRFLSLLVTRSVGPRIIALFTSEGENIFAEVPDFTLDCPGHGLFHLYGGHRLWIAPEEPGRTYLPDDDPVHIEEIDGGLEVIQPHNRLTGVQKTLRIRLGGNRPVVVVEHILTNMSTSSITCAPWAITQVKPGGTAFLPQKTDLTEKNPCLPNRRLILWPYTDINHPAISWGNDAVQVHANMQEGALKIGFPNTRGWMAYWHSGTLFIKKAEYDARADYFDNESSSECFCRSEFLELETLGPVCNLEPGGSISHFETWHLYSGIPWPEKMETLFGWIEDVTSGR
jgi:hypothetical protein